MRISLGSEPDNSLITNPLTMEEENKIWKHCRLKPQWTPFTAKDANSLHRFVRVTGGGCGEISSSFDQLKLLSAQNIAIPGDSRDTIETRTFNQTEKSNSMKEIDESCQKVLLKGDRSVDDEKTCKDSTVSAGILGYGRILFPESSTPSLYLRVPWKRKDTSGPDMISTHPQALLYFIENVWKLPRPRLLISVTGGAIDFPMDPHKEAVLEQLLNTARHTNAWIVTGGSRAGIMKYVGEFIDLRKRKYSFQKTIQGQHLLFLLMRKM
jgi:hypothetical protein